MADEEGLRWRGLGRWHAETWGNISDYYSLLPHSKNAMGCFVPLVIHTRAGRLQMCADWSEASRFCEMVARYTVHARVREWGLLGTRPEDEWPRTFDYLTWSNRYTPWMLGAVILGGAVWLWEQFAPKVMETAALMGSTWIIVALIPVVLLVTMLGLLPGSFLLLLIRARSRFDQQITVSPYEIVYQDRTTEIRASWKEVTDYYVSSASLTSCYMVETVYGSFDFTPMIRDTTLLQAIIHRYALNTPVKEWRARENAEILGGVAAKWSSGQEGVGQRIYHYQTRINRALIWGLATILTVIEAAIILEKSLGLTSAGSPGFPFSLSLGLGCGMAWGRWQYRRLCIRTDEHGIEQYHLFGRRFIAWQDVQDYRVKDGYATVEGLDTRIRFSWGIADVEELKDEIMRRAVHSRRRTWEAEE